MAADDLAHGLIREALLVVAERGGGVDAREDCRLTGSALRASINAEARVRSHEDAAVRESWLLALEDGERGCFVAEPVERICGAARANAKSIDENQQH